MASKKSSGIFLDEKSNSKSLSKQIEAQAPISIPYLKRGDSSTYINQFLSKQDDMIPKNEPNFAPTVKEEPKQENAHSEQENQSQIQQNNCINPSAFHNFQKHLTVALKHAIILPNIQNTEKDYVKAAIKLWKIFEQSKVCTKKVLHFLLGDKNEHKTTAEDLRQFGFGRIYESFGEKVIRQARRFLLSQSLRQIKEGCLDSYFARKKIKDKDKFKKYVEIFIQELEEGYLRKRLSRQKVAELLS